MTDSHLEQRLRDWYRAEVGAHEAAPAALRLSLPAIAEEPARLRVVRGRPRVSLLAAASIATALLVGGAIAVGSGLVQLPSVAPAPSLPVASLGLPTPSASTSPTARPSSPSPSPVSLGAPAATGMFAEVDDFLLATDTVGWVATPAAIYRTVDGGATWTKLRPPDWVPGAATAMVDADTMYVVAGSGPVKIDATHDGGATWVAASIDDSFAGGMPTVSFRTPSRGFVTYFDAKGTTVHVHATSDGGSSWSDPVIGAIPHLDASGDKIQGPSGGVLYLSPGKYDNKPFSNVFDMSTDGGATWQHRHFPVGALAPADALKWPIGFWTDGNGAVVLAITGDQPSIWTSQDDGRTWHLAKGWPHGLVDAAQLRSATDWVLYTYEGGSEIESTIDGGDHWIASTRGVGNLDLLDASFGSADHAWGVDFCSVLGAGRAPCTDPSSRRIFLATTDGGHTWARLDP